jgi:hypothetical protein
VTISEFAGRCQDCPPPSEPQHAESPHNSGEMFETHVSPVSAHLPGAIIVLGCFPVIKPFNQMLTNLSRELYQEPTDLLRTEFLRGGEPRRTLGDCILHGSMSETCLVPAQQSQY